jgi:hypothetical protein
MSAIPHYVRGHRLALRQVHRAVLRYGHIMPSSSALHVAADRVSHMLRDLSEIEALHKAGDKSIAHTYAEQAFNRRAQFACGYQAGFSLALDIVAGWGLQMNDPRARDAIAEAALWLHQARVELTLDDSGEIKTLREGLVTTLLPSGAEPTVG